MMLEHSFGLTAAARAIEQAVEAALRDGVRTADIADGGATAGTREMSAAVIERLA